MAASKRIVLGLLAVAVGLAAVASSAAQNEDGKKVALTVGIASTNFDSLNPIVGQTAVDYDVWNTQYATLTNKAPSDFKTIPGLAESWQKSNGGLTYTYKLRDGLEWSDGRPLTAEDIAYTINRARKEEWLNYSAYVQNLEAKAIDDRTVEITSKVPDPKLPGLGDVYILPKHIWERYDAKEAPKYSALDGVGSGPFLLDEFKRGQFVRMKANPSYWAGKRPIDEIVFRLFNNPDAMVAALEKGEIDAAFNVPSQAFDRLSSTEGIVAVEGQQGGFDELAINGGDGLEKPHPALLDRRVRVAIAHAIDKKTLLDRVWLGIGKTADALSPSPDPAWTPEIPAAERFDFDLAKANKILDDAGYKDTDGDGIREMPGGGEPLKFVYAVRSDSEVAPPVAEFITGWLKEIGIATTQKNYTSDQLITVIGKGDYDLFHWAWTPFVDPDPQISYFQCDQIASDPDDPTNYYNDANYCDPEYDKLYKQQNVELDHAKRVDLVHQMLRRFYDSAVYDVLALTPDLEAYRTDRFAGWLKQPAKSGPVIFSNTSPTYANLTPLATSSEGGGGVSTGAIVAIVIAALLALGIGALVLTRRRTADERE